MIEQSADEYLYVDVAKLQLAKAAMAEINKWPLARIKWMVGGMERRIDESAVSEFLETGLSNTTFLEYLMGYNEFSWDTLSSDAGFDVFSVTINAGCGVGPLRPFGTVEELLDAAKEQAVANQDFELAARIRNLMREAFASKSPQLRWNDVTP
jgi:hypothetical protein